jgi:hypothetical protein
MTELGALVEKYKKNFAGYEEWKLSDFRNNSKPIEELIRYAVFGILPDLKRDSHQFQISKSVLEEMVRKLQERLIIEELKKCKRFDDIFTVIYELKILNFSSLCVYDTALRIGAMFNLYPEVIYLHRGALNGAVSLLGKNKLRLHQQFYLNDEKYPYLLKEAFPNELNNLEPHHIENFLCRYKDRFK